VPRLLAVLCTTMRIASGATFGFGRLLVDLALFGVLVVF